METSDIEDVIKENPGISFAELKKKTGAANGQLQYHLKKADIENHGRGYVKSSFCSGCRLKNLCKGNCLRYFIRQDRKRKILKDIEDKKKMDIADDLDLTPSTLSYHVRELEKNNLIQNGKVTPEIKKIL